MLEAETEIPSLESETSSQYGTALGNDASTESRTERVENAVGIVTAYYVSPVGDDLNPGTLEKPFATVFDARDAIRMLEPAQRGDVITVYIRSVHYVLERTFVLNQEDGGRDGQRVIYSAYADEEPVFSSDLKITGCA